MPPETFVTIPISWGLKIGPPTTAVAAKSTTRWLLARLPEFIYSLANDGLYVNMYSVSSITWNKDGSKVTLNTSAQFPGDTNVSMRVLVENPLPLKIRLRLLSWASGGVTVLVNGQNAALGVPGTFVTLDRTWSKNDTIAFNIPIGFQLIKYTGFDRDAHYHRYALKYGPLLMALVGGTALNIPSAHLMSNLSPMSDSPLQFSISGYPNCKFLPYWHIQSETFTCFPTLR